MANLRMAAKRLLDKHGLDAPDDFLREMLELLINGLMQAEVSSLIGAEPYERAATRTTWRNGTRPRQQGRLRHGDGLGPHDLRLGCARGNSCAVRHGCPSTQQVPPTSR